MVDMSKKSAVSKRLDKPINPADMAFAKFMVKLYTSDRLAFYFKLKALLKNRFSLMDALERMYQIYSKDGKKPTESMAVAITVWMKQIRNGDETDTKRGYIFGCIGWMGSSNGNFNVIGW